MVGFNMLLNTAGHIGV